MTNEKRIKRAEKIIEKVLEQLIVKGTIINADDFRCGAVAAITALYPKEVLTTYNLKIL